MEGGENGAFAPISIDSPRVMFLHGLGETEAAWHPVIERLPSGTKIIPVALPPR